MDLIQVHNLVDVATHTETLKRWKAEQRVRYIGITHYTASAHAELERWLGTGEYDFLQINYSLGEREAERRLLPHGDGKEGRGHRQSPVRRRGALSPRQGQAAAALGGGARREDLGAVLPQVDRLAPGGDLRHPGHRRIREHVRDNVAAGLGALPDAAARKRMTDYFDSL